MSEENCLTFVRIGLNVPIALPFLNKDEVALKSSVYGDGRIGCCPTFGVIFILD